ncbi:hypothetical protein JHD49_10085 [Sulfurimonas sp. SAG-AH-194-C21]|nr:hypothetical protein [Sulfurimonas sp. SAG-AH-194-C21]MDF1884290.1 hypothetical protein [Sulfurimonas sp. SAG-AH-194-C21]
MSKSEKIKEQVGWLKIVFGILTAINLTLIAWLTNNYSDTTLEPWRIYLGVLIVLLVSFAIIYVNKKAISKIDALEEL